LEKANEQLAAIAATAKNKGARISHLQSLSRFDSEEAQMHSKIMHPAMS
jgi:hypothetical protein